MPSPLHFLGHSVGYSLPVFRSVWRHIWWQLWIQPLADRIVFSRHPRGYASVFRHFSPVATGTCSVDRAKRRCAGTRVSSTACDSRGVACAYRPPLVCVDYVPPHPLDCPHHRICLFRLWCKSPLEWIDPPQRLAAVGAICPLNLPMTMPT